MARKKKFKIENVHSRQNVFINENSNCEKELLDHFGNKNSLTLEIGCGRGDYSINLAKKHPERNFIGLDLKSERIWNGSEEAEELQLKNVAFLISDAEFLPEIFTVNKVDEIWIPFPDPHPKRKSEQRRLVSPYYLAKYREIMSPKGSINLKTDDIFLFEYAIEILKRENISAEICTADLYNSEYISDELEIKTKYEKQHIAEGKTIKYIRFKLD